MSSAAISGPRRGDRVALRLPAAGPQVDRRDKPELAVAVVDPPADGPALWRTGTLRSEDAGQDS